MNQAQMERNVVGNCQVEGKESVLKSFMNYVVYHLKCKGVGYYLSLL